MVLKKNAIYHESYKGVTQIVSAGKGRVEDAGNCVFGIKELGAFLFDYET